MERQQEEKRMNPEKKGKWGKFEVKEKGKLSGINWEKCCGEDRK